MSSSHRGRSRHHRALPPRRRRRLRLLLLMSLPDVDVVVVCDRGWSVVYIIMENGRIVCMLQPPVGGKKRARR